MKYILGSLVLFSSVANADVWLTSANKVAVNDLQFLSARSIVTTPVTTFPIPWASIIPQLKEATALTTPEQKAVDRLMLEYQRSQQLKVTARVGSEKYSLPLASNRQSDQHALNVSGSFEYGQLKGKLDADLVNGKLDGSYLAYEYSDWLFYASKQEQFWGPSNDASLIYSNYAEAVPSVGVQRVATSASSLPLLNLLGSWSFKAQMGQLESNRAVPNTKLWSARLAIKPFNSLEIGFNHVAQWGGDGFGNGISDFLDVITSKEYCPNGQSDCDDSLKSKFGNQLAGIDFNLQLNIMRTNVNLYGQTIGEDGSNGGLLPADKVTMFGLSTFLYTEYGLAKIYFESIDSNLSCGKDKAVKNCFYEHTTYDSGYRYKSIPIGSPYDNDTRSYVLGLTLTDGAQFTEVKIKQLYLNEDSSQINTGNDYSGHYLVDDATELTIIEYTHQYQWSENQKVSFEIQSKLRGSLPSEDDHIVNLVYQHSF